MGDQLLLEENVCRLSSVNNLFHLHLLPTAKILHEILPEHVYIVQPDLFIPEMHRRPEFGQCKEKTFAVDKENHF